MECITCTQARRLKVIFCVCDFSLSLSFFRSDFFALSCARARAFLTFAPFLFSFPRLSFFLFLPLPPSLSLSLPPSSPISLPPSLFLSLFFSLALSLPPPLSPSFSLALSLSSFLSLSLTYTPHTIQTTGGNHSFEHFEIPIMMVETCVRLVRLDIWMTACLSTCRIHAGLNVCVSMYVCTRVCVCACVLEFAL